MKTFLLAASAAALLATPALAQDAPAPTRTEGEYVFTGFRVEGLVGYSHQDVKLFSRDIREDFDVDNDIGTDAVQVGVGIGYDIAVSNFVIGAEASIDWTLGESRAEISNSQFPDNRFSIDYGRDIFVGGRRFRAGTNLLIYGKGGYTNLAVDGGGVLLLNDPVLGPRAQAVGFRKDELDGWRIGGGAELALPAGFLGGAAYAKAEFRYSDYEFSVSKQEALLGIGFRF